MDIGKPKHFKRGIKTNLVVLIQQSYMSGSNFHLIWIFIKILSWLFRGLKTSRMLC